ncbi:MAG TPA: type III-B CRISPR module RAMP protein Cmr4 [Rhodothermales bacterium]|nr:type III-B CRISPR module RAMP protein Cmr4 [Rhodothermales bacterium]
MFKASTLAFFYAETGLHAGNGQSLGAIDLAIQRERYTDFPVVAASGVKGAARDWFSRAPAGDGPSNVEAIFGPDTQNAGDHAGAVAFTDARTLLFPVRSARGVFAWTTCPAVLGRFRRDLALAGHPDDIPELPKIEQDDTALTTSDALTLDGWVLLEEYVFRPQQEGAVQTLATWLADHALPGESPEYRFWAERLQTHLVVLSDNAFTDFVRHSTEVQARVKLDPETKTTSGPLGNLFYQENLPADTLLYTAVLAADDLRPAAKRPNGRLAADELLTEVRRLNGQRIQLGGDETVGKGICAVRFL